MTQSWVVFVSAFARAPALSDNLSCKLGLCEARVWELFRRVTHDEFGPMYLDYAKGQNLSNRMPLFVEVKRKITLNDTM